MKKVLVNMALGIASKVKMSFLKKFAGIFLIYCFIISLFEIFGCGPDPCQPSSGGGPVTIDRDIYFSSQSDNRLIIFGINKEVFLKRDQGYLTKAVSDGFSEIHSPPVKHNLVYLFSNIGTGTKSLAYKNLRDNTVNTLIGNSPLFRSLITPVLSPDGKSIVVYGGRKRLFLLDTTIRDTNTSKVIQLTKTFCENTIPSISPNGRYIVFFEGESITSTLSVVVYDTLSRLPIYGNSLGRGVNSWVKDMIKNVTISWAPDNSCFMYALVSQADSNSDVVVIDYYLERKISTIVINKTGAALPTFSPSGRSFVFVARDGNLMLRDTAAKSEIYKLTALDSNSYIINPQWSPDGTKILYTKYSKNDSREYYGTLELIDVNVNKTNDKKTSTLIMSNAFKGFWYNDR